MDEYYRFLADPHACLTPASPTMGTDVAQTLVARDARVAR